MQTETEAARRVPGGRRDVGIDLRSQLHLTSSGRGVQGRPVHRADGKVVGHVRGRVFRKAVRGSRHQLKKPPAWAFDVTSLAEAIELGADRVVVRDVETGTVYSAPVLLVCQRGLWFDRGFGEQIALPLKHWDAGGEQAPSDVTPRDGTHPDGQQAQQLALDLD